MVRERGFEPLSAEAGWILSPVRLPVPPLSLDNYIFIRSWIVNGNYFMHFSGHVAHVFLQFLSRLAAKKRKSCWWSLTWKRDDILFEMCSRIGPHSCGLILFDIFMKFKQVEVCDYPFWRNFPWINNIVFVTICFCPSLFGAINGWKLTMQPQITL